MLQHPEHPPLFPKPPAIARNTRTDAIVINPNGRTEIRLVRDVREDPAHWYWMITILTRGRVRAETTSIGRLPHAMFHAIQACMELELLVPPWHHARRWTGRRFWHIRHGAFVETRLSCRCGPFCRRHRPLLTVNTMGSGQHTAVCLGKTFVADDAIELVRFVAEQLIARRYLR